MTREVSRPQTRRSLWLPYIITDPLRPCPACGYSLVGLGDSAAQRCPECGRELDVGDLRAEYHFGPIRDEVWESCALTLGAAAAGAVLVIVFGITKWVVVGLAAYVCWLSAILGAVVFGATQAGRLMAARSIHSLPRRREHRRRSAIAFLGLVLSLVVPCVLASVGTGAILWWSSR